MTSTGFPWWAGALVLSVAVVGIPRNGIADTSAFEREVLKTNQAMRKRDFTEALRACKRAFDLADEPTAGGRRSAVALGLCGDAEKAQQGWGSALEHYAKASRLAAEHWFLRQKLMTERLKAAKQAKASREIKWVEKLVRYDAEVRKLEKKSSLGAKQLDRALGALKEAASAYRDDGDSFRAQWMVLLAARLQIASGRVTEGVDAIGNIGAEKTDPRHLRAEAHRARWLAYDAQKELEKSVRSALLYNSVVHEDLTDNERRYGRVPELDALCERFDEERGMGACARMERRLTGRYTLTDFSRGPRRTELTSQDLDRVHRQGLVPLQDCVLDKAREDEDAYRGTDISIGWVISQEGRATEIEVKPRRYRVDLEGCAKERLSWLRYPAVNSRELKSVVIPYHLD